MKQVQYLSGLMLALVLVLPAKAQTEENENLETEEETLVEEQEFPVFKAPVVYKDAQLEFAINNASITYQRRLNNGFYWMVEPSLDWGLGLKQQVTFSPQVAGQLRYNVRYHIRRHKFEKQPFNGVFLSYGANLNLGGLFNNQDTWRRRNSLISGMGIGYQQSFLQYGYFKVQYQYGLMYDPIASGLDLGARLDVSIGARIGLGKSEDGKRIIF